MARKLNQNDRGVAENTTAIETSLDSFQTKLVDGEWGLRKIERQQNANKEISPRLRASERS